LPLLKFQPLYITNPFVIGAYVIYIIQWNKSTSYCLMHMHFSTSSMHLIFIISWITVKRREFILTDVIIPFILCNFIFYCHCIIISSLFSFDCAVKIEVWVRSMGFWSVGPRFLMFMKFASLDWTVNSGWNFALFHLKI